MRVNNWEDQLAIGIAEWSSTDFKWGESDCVCSSFACVERMTGIDPMAEFRGNYDDEESAKQLIKNQGHSSLYHMLIAHLGKPIKATFAQRGDIVYRKASLEGGAVGICIGAEAVFKSDVGWTRVKLLSCARAWRI